MTSYAMTSTLDGQILLFIQDLIRNPVLNKILIPYTNMANHGYLFIAMALLLIIIPSTRKTGYAAAFGLAISHLAVHILKHLCMRPRPYTAVEGLTALVDMSSDPNSFPSGHTAAAFAVCMVVFLKTKNTWVKALMLFMAVLMGFSRLYVGVHYPTDVLTGALLGTMGACLGLKLTRFLDAAIQQKKKEKEKNKKRKKREEEVGKDKA